VKIAILALLASTSLASAETTSPEKPIGRVVVTDTSCTILDPILFKPNDAHVLPRHAPMIQAVAESLLGNPSIRVIEINGFADKSEVLSDQLGLARANAVMAALVSAGVPMYRLRTATHGAKQPIDKVSAAKNRRIDFVILVRD
jgi:outer membrane protein OmpA-like peptidoglycan-associated protein